MSLLFPRHAFGDQTNTKIGIIIASTEKLASVKGSAYSGIKMLIDQLGFDPRNIHLFIDDEKYAAEILPPGANYYKDLTKLFPLFQSLSARSDPLDIYFNVNSHGHRLYIPSAKGPFLQNFINFGGEFYSNDWLTKLIETIINPSHFLFVTIDTCHSQSMVNLPLEYLKVSEIEWPHAPRIFSISSCLDWQESLDVFSTKFINVQNTRGDPLADSIGEIGVLTGYIHRYVVNYAKNGQIDLLDLFAKLSDYLDKTVGQLVILQAEL